MADHIKRLTPDTDGLDFESLRKDGIALIQDLCGKTWTDYNLHDPGITLLEQFCYGLTDLAYRLDFEPEDYLTDASGRIDYERLALYAPQDIFPSQPVTADDWRKVLYDEIPEIDDVWLKPAGEPHPVGTYSIHLRLDDTIDKLKSDAERNRVLIKARAVFARRRSLCEDVAEIRIVPAHNCYFLKGDIEIQSECDPAEILAAIYFRCARHVSSSFHIERYREVLDRDIALEQVFSGPVTKHGHVGDNHAEPRRQISIAELTAIIRSIDGVTQVFNLGLIDAHGNVADSIEYDLAREVFPCLPFPRSHEHNHLTLLFRQSEQGRPAAGGERERALFEEAERQYGKLNFEFQSSRRGLQSGDRMVPLPHGTHRDFAAYSSIQNGFPSIYGINRYGVPASAPVRRKAAAKQLKAYVYLFDQLLANYLQNLQELPALFSLDTDLQRSYFSQMLTDRELPGIDALYSVKPEVAAIAGAKAVGSCDNFHDRRNRVLDFMLGLYGERFSQSSLRRFNYYHERDTETWMIENKIRFLANIVELGRDRARAFDVHRPAWNTRNVSVLQKKVAILLGLKNADTFRSLTGVMTSKGRRVAPDRDFVKDKSSLPLDAAQPMPLLSSEGHDNVELPDAMAGIGETLFRNGFDLDNYRMFGGGKRSAKASVYFKGGAGRHARLLHLKTYEDADAAARGVDAFRRELKRLNEECEGLHIVEHILLRPRAVKAHRDAPKDFHYEFCLTAVFPNWTARFRNAEFRKLAEETVCLNVPAHIHVEFCWLDFGQMAEFEDVYAAWLEKLRGTSQAEFDAASSQLIGILARHKRQAQPQRKERN